MKNWFSLNNIRAIEELNPNEIAYLRKCTFKMFIPFWMLFRRQWDLFILTNFVPSLLVLATTVFVMSKLAKVGLLIISFILPLITIYIAVRYGRRIAWNRKKWESFKKFRKSEKIWGLIGCLLLSLFLGIVIYNTYNEAQQTTSEKKVEETVAF